MKNRGRKGQTLISQSFVLQPHLYTLLSRYKMCKLLYEWQGATSINTLVSGQRICPQVRIFIKNEFVSTSPHSFGSFPQKQKCSIASKSQGHPTQDGTKRLVLQTKPAALSQHSQLSQACRGMALKWWHLILVTSLI